MIEVLHPGMYNTIQDRGRFGHAKLGVPVSGVMDAISAELANALLRNEKTAAVVEITMGQGKFRFAAKTVFCLTGGDFSAELDGQALETNKIYIAEANSVLTFGKRNYGAITYLGVKGGIQSEAVMGSRSFAKGLTQIRIEKGDLLKTQADQNWSAPRQSRIRMRKEHFLSPVLDCYPGPEFDRISDEVKLRLLDPFTLSSDCNRVGYRLSEPVENELNPILTSAVLPGTVQLTPSGKLIVLMRDAQVTGGYPRVLQLADYAISRLSQKSAGDEVRFVLKD